MLRLSEPHPDSETTFVFVQLDFERLVSTPARSHVTVVDATFTDTRTASRESCTLSEIAASTTWQPLPRDRTIRYRSTWTNGRYASSARRHAAARCRRDILGGGEIRFGRLDQVETEIERCESPVVLDFKE